jgi:hypothetical protein
MSTTWYYGDVLTTGNTVVQQGLTVLGTTWTPNVFGSGVALGSASNTFGTLVASNANVTTLNTLSFAAGLAINVAQARGASMNVLGNIVATQSLGSNLLATRINVAATLNVLSFASPVAVNVASASGTSLYVLGNVSVSDTFGAGNVSVTQANLIVANIVSGTISAPSSPFVVTGNALVSNAILTQNLVATGSLNVVQANLLSVSVPLGINAAPGLSNLTIAGNVLASNTIGGSNVLGALANIGTFFAVSGNLLALGVGLGPGGTALAPLNVTGNVQVSNALVVSNVFVTGANIGLVLTTANLTSPLVGLGPGGTALALSPLNVTGNVQVSNALVGPNVFVQGQMNVLRANVTSFVNLLNVGLGTDPNLANVLVSGNVLVSNTLYVSPVVYASNANVALGNVQTLVSGLWDAGTVTGSVQVSNTVLVANAVGTLANVQTLNVASWPALLSLGLGAPGLANLQVAGNVFVSGNVTTSGTTSAQGQLVYGEDVTRRAPHLVPTSANASVIQAWIRASSNASRVSFGLGATTVQSSGVSGFWGSVLCPSGLVVLPPLNASNVGIWNSRTGLLTVGPDPVSGFRGGVLDPTGNVILVPWSSGSVGVFCPATLRTSLVPTGLSFPGYDGGCLAPTGNVIFFPYSTGGPPGQYNPATQTFSITQGPGLNSGTIHGGTLTPNGSIVFAPGVSGIVLAWDPVTGTVTTWGPVRGSVKDSFVGAVLDPLGNVVFVPSQSGNVVTFSPSAGTWSNIQACADGLGAWAGGTLLPSGNLVFFANSSANVGLFDPVALTFSNASSGSAGCAGGSLLINGSLVMSPWVASGLGVLSGTGAVSTQEFCTGPYFNKGP